jgi:tetraacyldisaccharide 4'-kinase
VIDGERGIGNSLGLPAGPLREPCSRLDEFDLVVGAGALTGLVESESLMSIKGTALVHLPSGNRLGVAELGSQVHAMTGIDDPQRFVRTLEDLGFEPTLRAFPNHHAMHAKDLVLDDALPVIITEKDALVLRGSDADQLPKQCYYLEIEAHLDERGQTVLDECLRDHGLVAPGAHTQAEAQGQTVAPG